MSRFQNLFRVVVLLNTILIVGIIFYLFTDQKQKIAVVRTGEVLEKFSAMKEARELISQEQAVYMGRLDTLEFLYNQAVNTYTENRDKFSKSEKQNLESLISKRQEDYTEYQQVAQNKIDEYTEKITQGVLNQVNDAVKVYAEKNNFDIVIGSNLTGNILYAKEQTDITTDIIDLLNSRQ